MPSARAEAAARRGAASPGPAGRPGLGPRADASPPTRAANGDDRPLVRRGRCGAAGGPLGPGPGRCLPPREGKDDSSTIASR